MQTEYERTIAWARKRRARILELRERGWSYPKIAAEMKISTQRVQQIVKATKQ